LWVAPRPGEGSVAAFSDEGFVMLENSMTNGCDGVSALLVAIRILLRGSPIVESERIGAV